MRKRLSAQCLRCFPIIVVFMILAGWFSLLEREGPFDPLMFGRAFRERALPEVQALVPEPRYDFGYDGQFYVQMAMRLNPADKELQAAMDNAPYRFRRIGWPVLVHLAGLGRPVWIAHIYLWSNLVCWLAVAVLLWTHIRVDTWSRAAVWFFFVTSAGMLGSVRSSLLDLPALAMVYLAFFARRSGRLWLCAGIVAAAALIKETSLLAAIMLWPVDARSLRLWGHSIGAFLLAAAPLLVWVAWLGVCFGWDQIAGHENVGLPGFAAASSLREIVHRCITEEFSRRSLWPLATWLGLAFQLACVARWPRIDTHSGKLGLAFAALLLVLGPHVWAGYVMAVPRVVLPFSLVAVLATAEQRPSWWWVSGHGLLALHGWDMLRLPLFRHIL